MNNGGVCGRLKWISTIILFQLVLSIGVGTGNVWDQGTQEDFLLGEPYNVDTISVPGKVILATEWRKYPLNPIVEGSPGAWDQYGASSPFVLKEGGTYKMWYSGWNGTATSFGYAESEDGVNWTEYEHNPVLTSGPPGSWESYAIHTPRILKEGSIYRMWYLGGTGIINWSIGYAESIDGISWTKSPLNPIMQKGEEGEWDSNELLLGSVIRQGSLYKMWYTGRFRPSEPGVGYATSPDGLNWTKHPGGPVMRPDGEVYKKYIYRPFVIFDGYTYRMWYTKGIVGDDSYVRYTIAYATSINGINWTKYHSNPILGPGPPGSFDSYNLYNPCVLNETGKLKIYYDASEVVCGCRRVGVADSYYIEEGVYNSSVLDTHSLSTKYGNISWIPTSQPPGTELKFQIASNNDKMIWDFVGPDGTPDTYYAIPTGQPLWSGHNDDRYLRYRAFLSTEQPEKTPMLDGVSITYHNQLPPASPPEDVQATLSGTDWENVIITWSLSSDDGRGLETVVSYEIRRSTVYDSLGSGYVSVAFLPNGTTEFVDNHAGEGDPSNYFYLVCAVDLNNNISCAENQAGKFTRPLQEGPNLVSVPLIQSDESIGKVPQTLKWDKAWYYDSSAEKWKWHMKFKPYLGELENLNHSMGVWTNVSEVSNLTVAGLIPKTTTIYLRTGWNLVGFPSFTPSYTIGDLKAQIGAARVEGFDPLASPYFLRVMSDGEFMQAGWGYWVYVETDTSWIVDNY